MSRPNITSLQSHILSEEARYPSAEALADDLRFTMTTGQARTLPRPAALLHVFNHATHHRGQITAAISMLGFECQPLDLPHLVFA